MPEHGQQIAALPMRRGAKDQVKVLMVTSRDSGRWVMPKGWQMDGKKPWRAAEIEALEEAGAKGHIGSVMIGTYRYRKALEGGRYLTCLVEVYPMFVDKLMRDWKERKERKRKWFTPKAAARRVDEPELMDLLLRLHKNPHKEPAIRKLLNQMD